ncbi:MAG TPA: hypothetical protein VFU22_27930 [Roseiflexaceae bacterium]|nr:hypothetical protein [Roseiflexaceae bacterium]
MQILLYIVRYPPQAHHLQARRAGQHLSGIVSDADTTMEKMLATVERLRLKDDYTGYLHLFNPLAAAPNFPVSRRPRPDSWPWPAK